MTLTFFSRSHCALAVFTVALFKSWPPLTPLMILWINLVTNGLPALALGVDPPEEHLMREPPPDRVKALDENALRPERSHGLLRRPWRLHPEEVRCARRHLETAHLPQRRRNARALADDLGDVRGDRLPRTLKHPRRSATQHTRSQ